MKQLRGVTKMIVKKIKKEFEPVVITLETEEEFLNLINICQMHRYYNDERSRLSHRFATETVEKLNE